MRLLTSVLNALWKEAFHIENGSSFHSFGPEYVKVFLKSSVFAYGICNFSLTIFQRPQQPGTGQIVHLIWFFLQLLCFQKWKYQSESQIRSKLFKLGIKIRQSEWKFCEFCMILEYFQLGKGPRTDCHDITEILLNVALNTIKQTNKQNRTYMYTLSRIWNSFVYSGEQVINALQVSHFCLSLSLLKINVTFRDHW